LKENLLRYLSAIIAIPIIIAVIQYGPFWLFALLVCCAFFIAAYEWLDIYRILGLAVPTLLGITFTVIGMLSMYISIIDDRTFYILFWFFLVLCGICIYSILRHGNSLKDMISAMTGLLFSVSVIVMASGFLMLVRDEGNEVMGKGLVYLLLATAWIADAGAMHIGRLVGRHKLAPILSPNKTIEGFLAAIVCGFLGGLAIYFIYGFNFQVIWLFAIAPAVVTASHIGDLTISLFKRAAKIKDSGHIIPGHGGFLDRLDNLLFSAPVFYLIIQMINGI